MRKPIRFRPALSRRVLRIAHRNAAILYGPLYTRATLGKRHINAFAQRCMYLAGVWY